MARKMRPSAITLDLGLTDIDGFVLLDLLQARSGEPRTSRSTSSRAPSVTLAARVVESGWNTNHPVLRNVDRAIEIAVTDTGIGIPEDKQRLIFEAFQQADATTSRKYGGTGLGLSISREIARLLGGELQVKSQPGAGSTFTLFVPFEAAAIAALPAATTARYENSGAAVPSALPATLEVSDDRDRLGSGPFVPHRRGRRHLRLGVARSRPRQRPQGRRSRPPAPARSPWRAS